MENQFKYKDGRKIWECGEVIVEGVRHIVSGGFVRCNPSLNNRAWNTTKEISKCEHCFKIEEAPKEEKGYTYKQLTLFD